MPNTKLKKALLKNHYHYGKMIYIAIILIAVLVADIIFTATVYRAPNENRVDIHLIAHYVDFNRDFDGYEALMLQAGQDYERSRDAAAGIDVNSPSYKVPLHVVEITGMPYDANSEDFYYQQQKYALMLTMQEGDILVLPREMMNELAETGMLADLMPYVENGMLRPGDMKRAMYYEYTEEDEESAASPRKQCLYGLSTESLTGMYRALGIDYRDKYVVVLAYGGNNDTAAAVIQWMIDEFTEAEAAQ